MNKMIEINSFSGHLRRYWLGCRIVYLRNIFSHSIFYVYKVIKYFHCHCVNVETE